MVDKDLRTYLNSLKTVDKSHLLKYTNYLDAELKSNKQESYVPQVDDVLLYFF